MKVRACVAALLHLSLGLCAWGEDGAPGTSPTVPPPVQPESTSGGEPSARIPIVKRKGALPGAKGKRTREKDAEGSEAADRFETDTVIKSRYRLNGEPLEVDPD